MLKVYVLYVQDKIKGIVTNPSLECRKWWDNTKEVLVPSTDYMDCKITVGTIETYMKNNPTLVR